MRPIDADALKEKTIGHGEKIAYVVSFIWDVDTSPTIAAIPVEWLKRLMLSTDDDVDKVEFAWIMREWHKEQEAR